MDIWPVKSTKKFVPEEFSLNLVCDFPNILYEPGVGPPVRKGVKTVLRSICV